MSTKRQDASPLGNTSPDALVTTVSCPLCQGWVSLAADAVVRHECGAVFGLHAVGACKSQNTTKEKLQAPDERTVVRHTIENRDHSVSTFEYLTTTKPFYVRAGHRWAVLFGFAEVRHRSLMSERVSLRPRVLQLMNLTVHQDGPAGHEIVPAAAVPPGAMDEAIGILEDALPTLNTEGRVRGATKAQIARAKRASLRRTRTRRSIARRQLRRVGGGVAPGEGRLSFRESAAESVARRQQARARGRLGAVFATAMLLYCWQAIATHDAPFFTISESPEAFFIIGTIFAACAVMPLRSWWTHRY